MSGYILCQNPMAAQPYFIENIQTNVYSLEEVCYYIYHNIYLVDRTMVNAHFFDWVSNELRLPSLAVKLRQSAGKFSGLEDFVYPVFKEINYLSYEELKSLGSILTEYDSLSKQEIKKRKADAFMANGMIVKATSLYEELLAKEEALPQEEKTIGNELMGAIYHNLGVAHSYLFQMDKASEYFRTAWQLTGNEEDQAALLLISRQDCTPHEFDILLNQSPVTDEVRKMVAQALDRYALVPEPAPKEGSEDEALDRIMREYHRCMSA